MREGLEILTHPLARGKGLAGALLEGGAAADRFPGREGGSAGAGSGPATRPVRLDPGAIGTTGPDATRRLERILAGNGTLVSTGQQPLLFLGPLFVLYKAISAVELARRIEAASGRPALALFWIASDDHDWEEVGLTRILDVGNRMREVRLEAPSGWRGRPVGLAPLPDGIPERLEEIFQYLPHSEFADVYIDLFRDAWVAGRTLGEAFAGTLSALLDGRPLAWLDAGAPEVKRAAAPLLVSALRDAEPAAEALAAGAAGLRELGHEPPLPLLPGATDVFHDTGEERVRLYRDGERVRLGRDGEARGLEETLEALESAPERFGPNAALRPVLESWLLPVGATVLGPGELAYWSQLPELFRLHDVPMPTVHPRHGWLLVESKVRKVLDKLGEPPEAFADEREVTARAVRDARPPEVEAALERLRSDLGRGMSEIEAAVAEHLPGIRSAVGAAKSQAFAVARELEERVDARLRERRDVVVEQIRKAAIHLYPDGPQERIQSPLYYLVRYGPGLLDGLEARSREETPPLWPEE